MHRTVHTEYDVKYARILCIFTACITIKKNKNKHHQMSQKNWLQAPKTGQADM